MLKSIQIKGFRGFHSLKVAGFKRVNLIVGESAAGKTALLEAVRLALGATPGVAWQLNAYRGLAVGLPPQREAFEAAWSPLFYDFDIKGAIELAMTDVAGRDASVRIYFDNDSAVTGAPSSNVASLNLPGIVSPGVAAPLTIVPLVFDRVAFTGETSRLVATMMGQGQLHFGGGAELGSAQEFFPASSFANSSQVAGWFSQASTANRERDIIDAVSEQFRMIVDLSVQAPPNQAPSIYATVRNKSHKLPVSLVSSGINKFISAITAVRQFRGGVVLIDEIENGIYFRKLEPFLAALHRSAVAADAQLFLTTHSLECLKAASVVMESAPEDFALVQMFQNGPREKVIVVPGVNAAAAIKNDIEVRDS